MVANDQSRTESPENWHRCAHKKGYWIPPTGYSILEVFQQIEEEKFWWWQHDIYRRRDITGYMERIKIDDTQMN